MVINMKAQTKVRAKNKFELVYLVRKKEADGWIRGEMFQENKRVKHFSHGKYGAQYIGDDVIQEWVCYMVKYYAEMDVKQ